LCCFWFFICVFKCHWKCWDFLFVLRIITSAIVWLQLNFGWGIRNKWPSQLWKTLRFLNFWLIYCWGNIFLLEATSRLFLPIILKWTSTLTISNLLSRLPRQSHYRQIHLLRYYLIMPLLPWPLAYSQIFISMFLTLLFL